MDLGRHRPPPIFCMGARWTGAQVKKAQGQPTEHDLQVSCVTWFRNRYRRLADHLFAIPNGASLNGDKRQRAIQWRKLEAEGALPGVADLFLAVPSGSLAGLWIEMKTEKGTQSKVQKQFEMNMIRAGFGYAMPRNCAEFERVVSRHLEVGEY